MADETLGTWNHKLVAANEAICIKSMELTRNKKQQWKVTYVVQFDDIIVAEDELRN